MQDQARDLASAGNLLKKHQLLETEMLAREVSGVEIPLPWDFHSKNGKVSDLSSLENTVLQNSLAFSASSHYNQVKSTGCREVATVTINQCSLSYMF